MKPLSRIRFVWLASLFVTLLTLAGAVANAEEKKELTLHQVNLQVEEAMERFRNASIAGAVTTKQREAVEGAYKKFKKAYDAAVKKAGDKEKAKKTIASKNVKATAEQVIAQVAAIPEF